MLKHSLGKEYRYNLLTPISTQLNNSNLRKLLDTYGFKIDAYSKKASKIIKNADEEYKRGLKEVDDILKKGDQKLKEIQERQRKWKEYYLQTGKRHPEQIEHLQKTLHELKSEKNQ